MRRTIHRLSLAGLAVSAALVLAFIVSLRWDIGYLGRPFVDHRWVPSTVGAVEGRLWVSFRPRLPGSPSGFHLNRRAENFFQRRLQHPFLIATRPVLLFPMWMPVVFFGVPSLIAWRMTRRPRSRPGHCRKCPYDLTGNVSGVCPECGARIDAS